jgi:hypothetical protein
VIVLAFGVAALGACHKQQQNQAATQDMSIEDNLSVNGADTNADIETLPPDESSTTPSNQLQNGYDNPDVNELGNSH